MITRRSLLFGSALSVAGVSLTRPRAAAPEKAPLDSELVGRFVGRSHFDLEAVREMLRQQPALVNAAWDWGNGDWETGLGAASHNGRREIALHILDSGARIDVFAATMLGYRSIVTTFLDELPDLHRVPGPHGIPLLSHAVVGRQQSRPLVGLLIERGAEVNAPSNLGITPLMVAASIGSVEAIELLLAAGADPALRDQKSRSALDWAQERDHAKAVQRLRQISS